MAHSHLRHRSDLTVAGATKIARSDIARVNNVAPAYKGGNRET